MIERKTLLCLVDRFHDWFLRRTYGITDGEASWKPPFDSNSVYHDYRHMVWSFQKFYQAMGGQLPEKYQLESNYEDKENEDPQSISALLYMLEDQRSLIKSLIQSMDSKDLVKLRTMLFKRANIPVKMSLLEIIIDYGNHMTDHAGIIADKKAMLRRSLNLPREPPLLALPDGYIKTIQKHSLENRKKAQERE